MRGNDAVARCETQWALVHAEDLQFACYRAGGYYRRHSDAQNASRRILTAIYYVNSASWHADDGGLLRIYARPSAPAAAPAIATSASAGASGRAAAAATDEVVPTGHFDIEPRADRLVVFDSRLEHEVLPVAEEGPAAQSGASKPPKSGKKRKKPKPRGPRCAATQWFQDFAPPLVRSALSHDQI